MKLDLETYEYLREGIIDAMHTIKECPETKSVLIYLRKALIELDVFEDKLIPQIGSECTICREIVPDGMPRHEHPCE